MKGRLSYEKWSVVNEYGSHYFAERYYNGKSEAVNISAHCLACAKAEILSKYGGRVDLRGWHLQGTCGSFLLAMQLVTEER